MTGLSKVYLNALIRKNNIKTLDEFVRISKAKRENRNKGKQVSIYIPDAYGQEFTIVQLAATLGQSPTWVREKYRSGCETVEQFECARDYSKVYYGHLYNEGNAEWQALGDD